MPLSYFHTLGLRDNQMHVGHPQLESPGPYGLLAVPSLPASYQFSGMFFSIPFPEATSPSIPPAPKESASAFVYISK